MSRAGWERQALNSIQSVLGHTDPELASHLAGFSRLASSEEMPAHERVRSPLRHPPESAALMRKPGSIVDGFAATCTGQAISQVVSRALQDRGPRTGGAATPP
jgi:hypothetical protein